jgi:hypothetical protein
MLLLDINTTQMNELKQKLHLILTHLAKPALQ